MFASVVYCYFVAICLNAALVDSKAALILLASSSRDCYKLGYSIINSGLLRSDQHIPAKVIPVNSSFGGVL
jgi:hypothetical protein